ncbi:DDE transposase family protein [Thiolinea disciformis]|uniref:DDE transposase family protein n=1 Tax=Thiolinea disciformis TaxID=125614 RepID=UPI00039AE0AC
MTAKAALYAVRSHWGIENKLHWVLVVLFKKDYGHVHVGLGAHNMAVAPYHHQPTTTSLWQDQLKKQAQTGGVVY